MELFQQIIIHGRAIQTALIQDPHNTDLRQTLDLNRLIRSEVERIERSPTDEQTLGVLVKMRKVATENVALLSAKAALSASEQEMMSDNTRTIEYIDTFLPTRLDNEDELYAAIQQFIDKEIAAHPEYANRPANAWKGAANKEFKGRADGKAVTMMVEKIVAGK